MDSEQIFAEFRAANKVPVDAVRAAGQRKDEVIPLLTAALERAIAEPLDRLYGEEGLIFLAVHLLGSWRITPAYRLVAQFLSSDQETVEWVLGDAVTNTIQRIMFNLFDGDAAPLRAIIENDGLDHYVRRRMLDAMGMLTSAGRIDRAEMADYLGALRDRIGADPDGIIWSGWAEIIAELGMRDLVGLVDQAYRAELIVPYLLSRDDFDRILHEAAAGHPMTGVGKEYTPFGDVVEELADWTICDDSDETDREVAAIAETLRHPEPRHFPELALAHFGVPQPEAFTNPYRYTGRNDPCPCGSGKKFKRCCGQWK
jgi:uncharacterized protein